MGPPNAVNRTHASDPNTSDERRFGVAIRYIATNVHLTEDLDSATVVRGVDQFERFEMGTRPTESFDAASMTA